LLSYQISRFLDGTLDDGIFAFVLREGDVDTLVVADGRLFMVDSVDLRFADGCGAEAASSSRGVGTTLVAIGGTVVADCVGITFVAEGAMDDTFPLAVVWLGT